jgi:large subunit ribosomal protein L23
METKKNNLSKLLNYIKYPLLTEKSVNLYGNRQYTFIVDRSLTKLEIKSVIETVFNISIIAVNTCNLPPKNRRVGKFIGKRPSYKKAFVTLKKGDAITELFN